MAIPELPDELHALISEFNKRSNQFFLVSWVKQGKILQIIIYECSPIGECFKNEVAKEVETTFPMCMPFYIYRMNEAANNWQLRVSQNAHTESISFESFREEAKTITAKVAKSQNLIVIHAKDYLLESIDTLSLSFCIQSVRGEAPCKAYLT